MTGKELLEAVDRIQKEYHQIALEIQKDASANEIWNVKDFGVELHNLKGLCERVAKRRTSGLFPV